MLFWVVVDDVVVVFIFVQRCYCVLWFVDVDVFN